MKSGDSVKQQHLQSAGASPQAMQGARCSWVTECGNTPIQAAQHQHVTKQQHTPTHTGDPVQLVVYPDYPCESCWRSAHKSLEMEISAKDTLTSIMPSMMGGA